MKSTDERDKLGVDSPITKTYFYYHTTIKAKNQTAFQLQKRLLVYKSCISITKVAFRLQIFNCQLQRWPFTLQSGISSYR